METSERRAFRRQEAASYIGSRLTNFHKMVNSGELPHGTVISGTLKVWFKEDLDAFLNARKSDQREASNA